MSNFLNAYLYIENNKPPLFYFSDGLINSYIKEIFKNL